MPVVDNVYDLPPETLIDPDIRYTRFLKDLKDAINDDVIGPMIAGSLATLMTTRGDLAVRGASAPQRLAKGAEHTVLIAGATDPAWGAVNLAQAAAVTGVLPDANVAATLARLNVEDQSLTGGARVTVKALGTITSGTVTPDPGDRSDQAYTNGGAHTLAPGSVAGSYWLTITNNGSAGAITTSGWTVVDGDSFTTTNGHIFFCAARMTETHSLLMVKAMQ
jgi:hypothetical protein